MALAETARLIASLELQDKFSATASKFDRTVVGMDQRTQRLGQLGEHIGQGLRSTGQNLARIGVIAGGVAIAGLTKSITLASDLNENLNKVKVVFGDSSQSVIDFSKNTADSLGLSQSAALEAEGAFGNMFNTIGLSKQQSAEFSTTLTKLGADMASFNNEDPSEMLLKLRSGLAGEAEPLRRFGVLLSEARVKQEAYDSGIAKSGDVLTEQQKVQARYQLILKDTAVQQGDFARTSDGLANAQRRLKASLSDIGATIGTALLPQLQKLAARAAQFLKDSRPAIESFAKELPGAFDKLLEVAGNIPWGTIGKSLELAGRGSQLVLSAFTSMPDWVQTAVLTGWGLNKLSGGALGKIFGDVIKLAFPKLDVLSRGATPANPMFTKEVGIPGTGTPGVPGGGGFGSGFLKGAAVVFGAAAAAELGNLLGHSLFFDPTVKPAVSFEQSQFDKLVASAQGDPAKLQHAIDVIQKGLDDMPLPAQLLARDQISILEKQRDRLKELRDEAVKQGQAAQENNRTERDLLAEAKAGRLATVHQGELTHAQLEKLTLEQRLQRDKDFHKSIESTQEFIRLLRRTSEFGAKGVGTSIEQGRTTGRDPVGDAFVALTSRLTKPALKSVEVQGEISRHIKALEQVQGRLLRAGNIADAKHAQQNIDKLSKLIGEVDKTIPHFRRIADKQQEAKLSYDRGAQKTSGLLGQVLGTERDTATNTGILTRKDFSPNTFVNVTANTNVSVNDVVRAVNTYSYAVNTYGAKIGNLPTG